MQYISFLSACRPTFPGDATEAEIAIVGEHFNYLVKLRDQGKLVLAGRTQDETPVGLALFEVDTEAEAQEIVSKDPAIAAGVFRAVLRPYVIAVSRYEK